MPTPTAQNEQTEVEIETALTGEGEDIPELPDDPEPEDLPFASEQSQLYADREVIQQATMKGRGGRKNKEGMPPGTTATKYVEAAIPRPKAAVFKSDATNPSQRTKAGWTYWASLPSWAQDRVIGYVYRDWPCLTQIPEDSGEFAYIDKISGNEPIHDDTDLLQKYGCGSYRIILSEQSGRSLFTAYIYSLGGSDLKSFPPVDRRVSDVAQVDLGRKENKSYMEFLRMRGLLPEQTDLIKERADVATVEAVKEMAGTTERMANKMVEMAEKRNDGGNITNEMIRDSIQTANEITKNAVAHALKVQDDIQAREATGQGSGQPSFAETFAMVTDLVDRMQTKNSGGGGGTDPAIMSELSALRQTVTEMQNQRIRSLEDELRLARTGTQNQSSSSLSDQIKALRELKGIIDEIGIGSGSDNPVAEVIKDNSPPWMKGLVQVAQTVLPAILARGQAGPQPLIPQSNPQQPTAPGQLQLVAPQPSPTLPGPAPTVQAPTQDELSMTLNYVAMPLLNYLAEPEMNGGYFAEWVTSGFGDEVFEMAKGKGLLALVQAIKTHPITGPGVSQIQGMTDARLEKFVSEFVAYRPGQDEGPVDTTTDVVIGPTPPVGA